MAATSESNNDIVPIRLTCLGNEAAQYVAQTIRTVPNFPKKGILFRDFFPALADPQALSYIMEGLIQALPVELDQIDAFVGLEARGFLLGSAMAWKTGKGFIAVRKPGKLPGDVLEEQYALEYGTETLQMASDAIKPGMRVLIVDDLIATGGSVRAASALIRRAGGVVVGCSFVMELEGLHGIESLEGLPCSTLLRMPA